MQMLATVLLVLALAGVELLQGAFMSSGVNTPQRCLASGPQTWYDDVKCVKYTCLNGFVGTSSCGKHSSQPLPNNCKYVKGTGRFPGCCTKLMCHENGPGKVFQKGVGPIVPFRGRQASEEA
ncbi:uncharacterized protein LOC121048250 [Ixodes scapularis]|uniref:uncharacterized protein LOC121048250 n=1 Tax=Ixodes scapularis TaxID=6945 RepID=UPI001AD73E69|nr:uncharacterized protein LOC121048250 [Ixodes scapularis]